MLDFIRPARIDTCDAEKQIRKKVAMVVADERSFGVLSTGERIAVAVVLDRYDLLQKFYGTIAESIYRLGDEWTLAALRVQREGWLDIDRDNGTEGTAHG
jgi:hypothetical protein